MASGLGIKELLGADGRERDLAYALIVFRVVRPTSKLSRSRWWGDMTLGADLGVVEASTDEVYAAMEWLASRQDRSEVALAKRHRAPGEVAPLSGVPAIASVAVSRSSTGCLRIGWGAWSGSGCCPGNTFDATSFTEAVRMVRDRFGVERITMVGDRGMMTSARIVELRELHGMEWITALRAPAVAALAADDGPL